MPVIRYLAMPALFGATVRGAGPRKARCYVDASEVGNPRGFNSPRELD